MTRRKLLVVIPLLFVFLNGVGYLIFAKVRTGSNSTRPIPPSEIVRSAVPQEKEPEPKAKAKEESSISPEEKEKVALARRAAGLAALEAGNYDKALINFTEARSLMGDRANVDDLLRVTEDLRAGGSAAPRTHAVSSKVPVSASGSRTKTRTQSERRVALKDEPLPPEGIQQTPSTSAPSGLLIVTTSPRGLLVQVDETAVDLTPMRTKVKPGSHRVVLLDGDRKVFETTVDIKDGQTSTLLKDLPVEPPPEAPRPVVSAPAVAPSPPPAPVAAAKDEAFRLPAAAPATPKPSQADPADLARDSTVGNNTGSLDISSPGLYGVVWVNDRPRGYPPLVVRGLPVGPAKVEVRVNGIRKRASTIVVKPDLTTSVQLRSQETGT